MRYCVVSITPTDSPCSRCGSSRYIHSKYSHSRYSHSKCSEEVVLRVMMRLRGRAARANPSELRNLAALHLAQAERRRLHLGRQLRPEAR